MTVLIIIIFIGGPLSLFAFIIGGAIYPARQQKKVWNAVNKYLRS